MAGIEKGRKRLRSFRGRSAASRRAVIAACLAFVAARLPAAADAAGPPVAASLTPQDSTDLQRIAAYLSSIRTLYAKFQQVSAGGGDATGPPWMALPSPARVATDAPAT